MQKGLGAGSVSNPFAQPSGPWMQYNYATDVLIPVTKENKEKKVAVEGSKIAAAFEVLYKTKLLQKAQSQVIVAATKEQAQEIFLKQFEGDDKQPKIVAIEDTVVTL